MTTENTETVEPTEPTGDASETETETQAEGQGTEQAEAGDVTPEIAEKLADLRAQVAHKSEMLKEGKSNMAGAATRKINQLSDELRGLGVEETVIDAINNGTDDVERPLEGEQASAQPASSTPKRKGNRPEPESPQDRKKGELVLAYHPRLHPGDPSPADIDADFQAVNTYVWVIFRDNGVRCQTHKNNVFSTPADYELPEGLETSWAERHKPEPTAEAAPEQPEQEQPADTETENGESQTESEQAEQPAEEPAQS